MEETSEDAISLVKGINLRELMTGGTEFQIDFKKKPAGEEFIEEDDDSEDEDFIKGLEESTEKLMLSSPEYHTFDELATKMVDCVPSGDVKILIIEEGDGPVVPQDAEVSIHYAAYWEKEKIPFDSTLTMNFGAPTRIRLGCGKFLPGLELGISTVRGPRARLALLLAPRAAWGELGAPPRIRPERALFVVALYEVRDVKAADRFYDLPTEEQSKFEVAYRTVTALHTQSKDLFVKKQYSKAIRNYEQSLSILNKCHPQTEDEKKEQKTLKVNAYLNMAVCNYKINKPKRILRTLEALDYVIDAEKNCKALFYYGRAYEKLGKMDDAISYYQKALKLEPKNKDIGKALDDLDAYLKKSAKNEREMWKSVFKTQKKDTFEIDEDFQNNVRDMFKELTATNEYAKFDLPPGLTNTEVDFVKSLTKEFEGLVVQEDGEGRRKKVTIVKKILY